MSIAEKPDLSHSNSPAEILHHSIAEMGETTPYVVGFHRVVEERLRGTPGAQIQPSVPTDYYHPGSLFSYPHPYEAFGSAMLRTVNERMIVTSMLPFQPQQFVSANRQSSSLLSVSWKKPSGAPLRRRRSVTLKELLTTQEDQDETKKVSTITESRVCSASETTENSLSDASNLSSSSVNQDPPVLVQEQSADSNNSLDIQLANPCVPIPPCYETSVKSTCCPNHPFYPSTLFPSSTFYRFPGISPHYNRFCPVMPSRMFPSPSFRMPSIMESYIPNVACHCQLQNTACCSREFYALPEQVSSEPKSIEKNITSRKTPRPRQFQVMHFSFGKLVIDVTKEPVTHHRLYRAKMIFSSKKFSYEFESKHLEDIDQGAVAEWPLARIDVPWTSVKALRLEGKTFSLFVDVEPSIVLGRNERNASNSNCARYRSEPLKGTFIGISSSNVHKVEFKTFSESFRLTEALKQSNDKSLIENVTITPLESLPPMELKSVFGKRKESHEGLTLSPEIGTNHKRARIDAVVTNKLEEQ